MGLLSPARLLRLPATAQGAPRTMCAFCIPVSVPGLAPQAVLLTGSVSLCLRQIPSPAERTSRICVTSHPRLKSFSCNTYQSLRKSTANKRLTVLLNLLDATLTKNIGGGVQLLLTRISKISAWLFLLRGGSRRLSEIVRRAHGEDALVAAHQQHPFQQAAASATELLGRNLLRAGENDGERPQIEAEREDVKDVVDSRPAGDGQKYLLELSGIGARVPQSEHLRENERASDGRPNNRQQGRGVDGKAARTARGTVQAKGERGGNREEQRRKAEHRIEKSSNPDIFCAREVCPGNDAEAFPRRQQDEGSVGGHARLRQKERRQTQDLWLRKKPLG